MLSGESQPFVCEWVAFRDSDEIFTHRIRCAVFIIANIVKGAVGWRLLELIPDSIRDRLTEQRKW